MEKLMPAAGCIFVFRSVNADLTAHGGFKYPLLGKVSAPDFDSSPTCGKGLHGFAKGEGDHSLLNNLPGAVYQVLEVREADIIRIDGKNDKVKFPKGNVVFSGDRDTAVSIIKTAHPEAAVMYAKVIVGDKQFATAGNYGTVTAGDYGTATAGYNGTATAGYNGTATAGNCGTATAGYHGTATAGYHGTATAGDYGTATAGYNGTATAGNHGTATAGDYGTATAGNYGMLCIKYYDGSRYRMFTAYVGENGILPNVKYKLNKKQEFVKA